MRNAIITVCILLCAGVNSYAGPSPSNTHHVAKRALLNACKDSPEEENATKNNKPTNPPAPSQSSPPSEPPSDEATPSDVRSDYPNQAPAQST